MKQKTAQLTPALLNEITQHLLEEKKRITHELGTFAKKTKAPNDYETNFENYGSEIDDDVLEIEQYTVNKPLEMSLENTLRDINKALERIQDGTYGICKYCDKPIDENRLRARPTSSACVSCKKVLTDEA